MSDAGQELVTGGQLIAKALRAEGVEVVFTPLGGRLSDLHDGCADAGIELAGVRHGQMAVHAADGYARLTGKPGCAVVTDGRGITDAVTGVATAYHHGSPVLLIGGQGAYDRREPGPFRNPSYVELMTPITTFAATVPDAARVAEMVSTALRACRLGAPGPSFLEIPRDVLDAKVPLEKARIPEAGHHRSPARPAGDPEAVEKLAGLLVRAEKPAVLFGGQVWTTGGTDAAVALVRALNVPAYMTGAGRGTLPPGDPHHFLLSRRYAFANADLLVVVGTPFDSEPGHGEQMSPAATVVRIGLGHRAPGERDGAAPAIEGEAGPVLAALIRAVDAHADSGSVSREAWLDELRAAERTAAEMLLPQITSDAVPVHPYRLVHEIDAFLTEDSVHIGDGGDLTAFAGRIVRPKSPGHWMDPGPLGAAGAAVPFALAAGRARPGKEVVALLGADAFARTGWDFALLVRHRLPFIGVVGNTLGAAHYDTFAQMLGGYGEEVRDPADIAPALLRARESGLPSLIDVRVDPDAYVPGTMNQTMDK
ncbi:thiamine pyrophosphate-binding protein [Streptomyces sp. NPDC002018]|uniref:thiamine pyrophosphate-binding protein n=1 Tax=Streptomyces sp. NPDC002018 TaxID=3364629 RepID=UPI00368E6331